MKKRSKLSTLTFLAMSFVFILANGCKTENQALLPVLTTTEVTSISSTSAKSGGIITSDAGSIITARGVCWSTTGTPSIADTKTSDGGSIGSFTSSITGLTATTIYYVRAYATNSEGTGYGSAYQFTSSNNPASITTALIPAGTFAMGSPTSEVNRKTDETQHSVTLTAFRMSKYEIINAQYATFLNAKSIGNNGIWASAPAYPMQTLIVASSGSYDFGLHYSGNQWVSVVGYETSPVINVTWYGAAEFATYTGGTLPTEAQWEYACRGGTNTPFSTGNFLTNLQANYYWVYPYNGGINSVTTYPGKTQPVGTYAANAYELYDMHGNVQEWCSDWYGTYPSSAQNDPTGANTGSGRVLRGGNWYSFANICRSAYRSNNYPYNHNINIGFRVVFVP